MLPGMNTRSSWGVVATAKAPDTDILNFAAHHLDLGAARVHVYLDADAPAARAALDAHPACRVTLCDRRHWRRLGQHPRKHQVRQAVNATACYNGMPEVAWLAHIDVDEFLIPARTMAGQLADVTADAARIRPVEAMAPDPDDPPPDGVLWCKGCAPDQRLRLRQTPKIYPRFGGYLNGGFLSHITGKVFARTGLADITLNIHRSKQRGTPLQEAELTETLLCHLHAPTLEKWRAAYAYRKAEGSYRDSLKPFATADGAGINMHALLEMIELEGGMAALDDFYREVAMATPERQQKLARHGHLHAVRLGLAALRAKHFPGCG